MMPPIVHGWWAGSPQFGKPVATNSCGVHASSKIFCVAATFGVPTWNTDASTWSFSTSSVASGGVLVGSYASSFAMRVTLWPSMPPASFTFANTAFMPLRDRAERGECAREGHGHAEDDVRTIGQAGCSRPTGSWSWAP